VQLADTLADKHMADKHMADMHMADMHMDIEADSPTNVDIFYLFLAMPFLMRSFTSIPCMALESAKMDKRRMDRHKRSMDTSSSSRKLHRAIHNQRMVVHIHIADMPTTILEAMRAREIYRKPKGYTGKPTSICRILVQILCQSQTTILVSAKAANS
jgi:hypothetical protein